jgi:hypothetical protein
MPRQNLGMKNKAKELNPNWVSKILELMKLGLQMRRMSIKKISI